MIHSANERARRRQLLLRRGILPATLPRAFGSAFLGIAWNDRLAMRRTVIGCLALALIGGCATGLPWSSPFGPEGAEVAPNPMFVAGVDPAHVWETVVDVIDDDFRIQREEPVRCVGGVITEGRLETFWQTAGTAFEPWSRDSASAYDRLEATLQTQRRQVVARVSPAEGGFWIEITAFKELEDLPQPTMGTMGAATFRYDGTLTRVVNPVGEQGANPGWIRQGRDTAVEQFLIHHLQSRFAGIGEPHGPPPRVRQTGQTAAPPGR